MLISIVRHQSLESLKAFSAEAEWGRVAFNKTELGATEVRLHYEGLKMNVFLNTG